MEKSKEQRSSPDSVSAPGSTSKSPSILSVRSTMIVSVFVLVGSIFLVGGEKFGAFASRSHPYLDVDTPIRRASPSNQTVIIDPRAFNVLGPNNTFRSDTDFFNPTNTAPPFFQIFSPSSFLPILGSSPSIRLIASNSTFAFAHEAPVWIPDIDEVFFSSNDGGAFGMSDLERNNLVSRVRLGEVRRGGEATVLEVPLDDKVQMTNGGTNYLSQILLITSGRGTSPPSLVLVNPKDPFNTTVLLDNYFGRQFNSLNDVKIHPSGGVFFTDVTYGFLNHFRPTPALPNQVYRFDPETGSVRVVADGFDKCNGLAFSKDGKEVFVTDTGLNSGFLGLNSTEPATIYKYTLDPKTQSFTNRRVFAYVDNGVADGIQLDTRGNVYAGCGDGVQIWDPKGTLIGKIFLGTTSANMAFTGDGTMVVLAERELYFVRFDESVRGVVEGK